MRTNFEVGESRQPQGFVYDSSKYDNDYLLNLGVSFYTAPMTKDN